MTLDLTIGDGPTDVAAGSYDLVIRRAAFVDNGLTALDLGSELRHVVIAAPDYLATLGEPNEPSDLKHHRCIRWRIEGGDPQRWRFEVEGEPLTLAVEGPLIVSNCDAAVAGALQGIGVAYVLESYCTLLIADGRLISLLQAYLPSFGGWRLCYSNQMKLTAASRAIAQLLSAAT